MIGKVNRHAQWESLNGTALVLAVHGDHGDGNAGAWHAGDEFLVVRSVGEREVDNIETNKICLLRANNELR